MHTYRTTIDFDKDTMALLKGLAFEEKVPMKKIIYQALGDYVIKKKANIKKKIAPLGRYSLGMKGKWKRAMAYE